MKYNGPFLWFSGSKFGSYDLRRGNIAYDDWEVQIHKMHLATVYVNANRFF